MDISKENLPVPIKKELKYDKHDAVFSIVMFVLGYLFVDIVLFGGLGLGVTVFTPIFIVCLAVWFSMSGRKISRVSIVFAALMLILSLYFALFDSIVLKPFALLMLMGIACYFVAVAANTRVENRIGNFLPLDLLDSAFLIPLSSFVASPRILAKEAKESTSIRNYALLALGLIISIPIVLYAAWLLINADAAFEGFLRRFADQWVSDLAEFIVKALVSIPVSFYIFALLFGSQSLGGNPKRSIENATESLEKTRIFPSALVLGVVTPLLLLYAVFFMTQTAYLTSAMQGLLPEGYDYAQYAKRGFYELCAVCTINFAVISVFMLMTRWNKGRVSQIYTTLLSLSSIAMAIMSLSKMLLFIGEYGLTPKRAYTSVFMVLLIAIFLLLIIRAFNERFNASLWISASIVSIFLLLCFSNPDYWIAKYNVEVYKSGTMIYLDIDMLCSLSPAAAPCLIEIAEMDVQETNSAEDISGVDQYAHNRAVATLESWKMRYQDEKWSSHNIGRWKAYELIIEWEKRQGLDERRG